ncbi:hypothetical protein QQM79_05315 [Marinobacteraceae bacterium S3BR75-40.1]
MRLILLLIVLVIGGLLVARQLQTPPPPPSENAASPDSQTLTVPQRAQDVKQFEKDFNDMVEENNRKQQQVIEDATQQ